MEKELYRILQEIKIGINTIENIDVDKYLRELDELQVRQIYLYDFYFEKYFEYKFKFRALSILTLGIYYLKNKYDYDFRCELYEGAINQTEDKYFDIICDKVFYKLKGSLLKEKLDFYEKNFEQIDNFFKFIKDLPEEEKEKYLTYKIN